MYGLLTYLWIILLGLFLVASGVYFLNKFSKNYKEAEHSWFNNYAFRMAPYILIILGLICLIIPIYDLITYYFHR